MPSTDIVTPPASADRRIFAVAWACIFLVLINVAVFFLPERAREPNDRLPYDPAYEDILSVLHEIEKEERPTVVMLGGSVAWGVGHGANQTIANRVQEKLGNRARVFNLAMIGARPLDEFLLAHAVRESADVIVLDYNYELGADVPHERLLREPDTYVRHRQLLAANAREFLTDIPGIETCHADRDVALPVQSTIADRIAHDGFRAVFPLIARKHDINRLLFGQHPLVIAERMLRDGGNVLRGEASFGSLFVPPADRDPVTPWTPPGTEEERALAAAYATMTFSSDTLRACHTKAFAAYAARTGLPVIPYLTPLNPAMFPALHEAPVHEANVRMFMTLFDPVPLLDLDRGTMPAEAFTDSTHLTATGASTVADSLLPEILRRLSDD